MLVGMSTTVYYLSAIKVNSFFFSVLCFAFFPILVSSVSSDIIDLTNDLTIKTTDCKEVGTVYF